MPRGYWETRTNTWSESDLSILRRWYAEHDGTKMHLQELADSLGRLKSNVCRKARSLGLTNQSRTTGRKDRRKFKTREEYIEALRRYRREWLKNNPHPRGALGMKHTPETLAIISAKSKAFNAGVSFLERQAMSDKARATKLAKYGRAGFPTPNTYSRCRRGKRSDIGDIMFRSRWEANYARFLNFLKLIGHVKCWEYEVETFRFDGIKRGTLTYTPDFRVTIASGAVEYHEVKGWMNAKSATRLKRMRKYHPSVKVVLIDEKRYRAIEKEHGKSLPNWESK